MAFTFWRRWLRFGKKPQGGSRLGVERLEDRLLPSGDGLLPLAQAIHVSAGQTYRIVLSDSPASVSLFYDTDRDPASGLVPIAVDLTPSSKSFDWQIPVGLVGQTCTLYASVEEDGVRTGSYAAGSLTVDPVNSDRLLSAPVTTGSDYQLRYQYQGSTYVAGFSLHPGDNDLFATVNGVTHEYHVTQVPTLADSSKSERDEMGNVTKVTDAIGQSTSIEYDQLSRVSKITYADGSAVAYQYDVVGNLLSMHDASGWQLYTYDERDRLTSVTYSPTDSATDPAALTLRYEYDAANQLTALTYPSGKRVEYGHDVAGRLTSVTEKNDGQPDLVTWYSFSPTTGLLAKTSRPNDTETLYSYDTSGRLIDILHRRTSTSALILQYHYTLDASGRRTQVVVTSPTGTRAEAYQYDQLDRLSQVTYSDNNAAIESTDRVVKYTYDLNGNRLTMTTYDKGLAAAPTETLKYVYGPENRLLSITDQNGVKVAEYFYDWRGNQVMKVSPEATTRYTYDGRNLLVGVDDGTNHVEYRYDGAGRRVGETVNGVEMRFVVEPTSAVYQTLEERDATGSIASSYTYGLERISEEQTGRTYLLSDGLGSVGGATGANGATLGTTAYDVFGMSKGTRLGTAFGFTGERADPTTGLIFLRNREYDPETGRFLQKDPAGFIDGTARYSYANADPVNARDPLGLYVETAWDVFNIGLGLASFGYNMAHHEYGWATLDALGLAYDGIATAVPFLPAGASFALKAGRGAGTALDVARLIKKTDQLAAAADVSEGAAAVGTAIHRAAGEWYDATRHFGEDFLNFARGANSATGKRPDFHFADLSHWIDITTVGQWAAHVRTYASTFGEGTSILYKAGVGVVDHTPLPAVGGVLNTAMQVGSWLMDAVTGSQPTPQADEYLIPVDGTPDAVPASLQVGGVLIDKAAQLVGSNLHDIAGATFDPVSHQLVFLGSDNPAAVKGINLDYFISAIQSVFGSAVPPYVTLDPPARLVQPSFDLGDGDGVIKNGKTAQIVVHHKPYTPTEADDMSLTFKLNGKPVSLRIDSYLMDIFAGGRQAEGATLLSTQGLPSGFTATMPPKTLNIHLKGSSQLSVTVNGIQLQLNAQGQDSYWAVSLTNNTGATQTVTDLQLVTDLQERKFGGRVDNTQVGWIMFEADRIVKDLAIGKEQLTGTSYDSHNSRLPAGFRNMLERYLAAGDKGQKNIRMWLTPDYETLKRYVDPASGDATVVFDQSSVKLNTESLLLGKPEDPIARDFADFFNAHYDEFARLDFPVHDPNDPTKIIQVKIFDKLRDVMKGVALARFFHDNNIPLDTWWLNSWSPPTASIPATIPTLSNSVSSGAVTLTAWGGVDINKLNDYVADPAAQIVGNAVLAQRTTATGDLGVQAWNVASTPVGNLNAVAASLDAQQQDAGVAFGVTDLGLASPAGQLAFERFYDSGYLGNRNLGPGWRTGRFELQFQLPSLVDDAGLMRDAAGHPITVYGPSADSRLRAGQVRLVDHATGQVLDFTSSLMTSWSQDSQGKPIFSINGLGEGNVPTFAAGQFKDGSTLVQSGTDRSYTVTRPDGGKLVFDAFGNLLSTTDRRGNTITYTYTDGKLTRISDAAGQSLTVTYDVKGRIQYVVASDSAAKPLRRAVFLYDTAGRLAQADTQVMVGTSYIPVQTARYLYNTDNQLTGIIGPDGVTSLVNSPDLRGRSSQRQDALGNKVGYNFTQDNAGQRTTQVVDLGTTGVNNPTAEGLDALRYVAAGAASSRQIDASDRTTSTVDALGHVTAFGYSDGSRLPTSVTLPTPGRPAISIEHNALNLPTAISDPANPGAAPVEITYNDVNLPVRVTDARGRVTLITYTSWNDVETVTVAAGTPLEATTTYRYNEKKLLQSVIDPLSRTVASYTYDDLARITSVTDAAGLTTRYVYDSLGRLKRVYDPTLTGTVNWIEYTYNNTDQVTQISTPTGAITCQYDPNSHRLMAVSDLAGNTTRYAYDATGLVTSVTQVASAGNAVTQQVYDRLGNPVLVVAPNGVRTAFQYDALGRAAGLVEDDGNNPTARLSTLVTSSSTVKLNVHASEPILVASVKYWLDGQPGTARTQSVRLDDQTDFAFELSGLDTSKSYRYQVSLTDRVGRTQVATPGAWITGPNDGFLGVRGQSREFLVGADDATLGNHPAGFTYTITWGDGSPTTTVSGPNGLRVAHTFLAAGNFTVTVTARNTLGATGAAASLVVPIIAAEVQNGTLLLGGTPGNDSLTLTPRTDRDVTAAVNGVTVGTFHTTGLIQVLANAGIDTLTLNDQAATQGNTYTATLGTLACDGSVTIRHDAERVVVSAGSSATDTLAVGLEGDNLWKITGPNTGQVGNLTFSGVESLVGGAGNDTFQFGPSGTLRGTIDGGAGSNWLDYSLRTVGVSVNLATGVATSIDRGAGHIQNVIGGSGADSLSGNDMGNILVGGAGNDTLIGGLSRNLLIGGLGSDTILGGSGDDLTIACRTTLDANQAALLAILADWKRTDRSYADRVLAARTSLIWGKTVLDDAAADTLTGNLGIDWFFANLSGGILDVLRDKDNGGSEQVR